MYSGDAFPKMLISPAKKHCSLDLGRILNELQASGRSVFCCAYCNFPDIRREICGFLADECDTYLHSMAITGGETPVFVLYDSRRIKITVEEAHNLAGPIFDRCRGCWTGSDHFSLHSAGE